MDQWCKEHQDRLRPRLDRGLEVVKEKNEVGTVHDDQYKATQGADALVLVTEWKLYWIPDYKKLAASMRQKVLVDGRNIWPQETALDLGFTCHAIGRPTVG